MPEPVGQIIYNVSTFQSLNGDNYTLTGIENKFCTSGGNTSAFFGLGTDCKDNVNAIIDIKGSVNYDKKGISGQNVRIRTKLGENTQSIQFRYSPLSLNVPLGKTTSAYLNPHYSGTIDCQTNKWTHSIGAFAGVTKKINDWSVSLEAQRYNLQDLKDNSNKNWSINAIVSYKF